MSNLVTPERAAVQVPAADPNTLSLLIAACSRTVERYCRRSFAQADYDELLTTNGGSEFLFVTNPPITSVAAVRSQRMPAVWITCTDPCQAATVNIGADRLTLTKIKDGTTTPQDFLWTIYPTLGVLTAAVNTYGQGFSATCSPQFVGWQSADLRPEAGAQSARGIQATLNVYWWYHGDYAFTPATGEIRIPGGTPAGYQSVRVQYRGGYADIPDDLQQAVCELIQNTLASAGANPLMQSETLGAYSYTRAADNSLSTLSWASRQTINSYKRVSVPRWV